MHLDTIDPPLMVGILRSHMSFIMNQMLIVKGWAVIHFWRKNKFYQEVGIWEVKTDGYNKLSQPFGTWNSKVFPPRFFRRKPTCGPRFSVFHCSKKNSKAKSMTLTLLKYATTVVMSHYIPNPNNAIEGKMSQIFHRFPLLDPQHGNGMIPVQLPLSL